MDIRADEHQLIAETKILFAVEKPAHFTNHEHCEECAEHDETLRNSDMDKIGMVELGNPGWDPVCFCTADGLKYYLPAFIRLSIDTVKDDFYFGQFLFHLEYEGTNNKLLKNCSDKQKSFIASFLKLMIEQYSEEIESNCCSDDALRTYEIWSKP